MRYSYMNKSMWSVREPAVVFVRPVQKLGGWLIDNLRECSTGRFARACIAGESITIISNQTWACEQMGAHSLNYAQRIDTLNLFESIAIVEYK